MGKARWDWLGVEGDQDRWRLPVRESLVSGADALFGGCATAAAIAVAAEMTPQPVIFVSTHFGALAKRGSTVEVTTRTISTGRTMTHLEVSGSTEGRESFTARVTAGHRPTHDAAGQWVSPPDVVEPANAESFDHPVHAGTWAQRFEWRLAGTGTGAPARWAAWWVRSLEPIDSVIEAAVLCDYVTYGMGRALQRPMGGLSVDNCLRIHCASAAATEEWRLLQVIPEAIAGGFGSGTARLFSGDTLIAQGSQSIVMNNWDWRLPRERDDNVAE